MMPIRVRPKATGLPAGGFVPFRARKQARQL